MTVSTTGTIIQNAQTATGSNNGEYAINFLEASEDVAISSRNFLQTLLVSDSVGGSSATGNRGAGQFSCILTAPTSGSSEGRNYVGLIAQGVALSGDNGSSGTPLGAIFGINPIAQLGDANNNATFLENVTGGEVNVIVNTGSSVHYKTLWQLVGHEDDRVKGSVEAMLALSTQSASAPKWDYGILIGDMNNASGVHPINTTSGVLIGTSGSPAASTAGIGIDFSSYNFNETVLKAPDLSLNGGGLEMRARSAFIELAGADTLSGGNPYIDFHSSGNTANDYDARIIATGGNSTTGNGTLTLLGAVVVGAPTGGAGHGAGTINAVNLYANNSAVVTCYAIDAARNGGLDLALWDSLSLDGTHEQARSFAERDDLDVDSYARFWKTEGHLPALPSQTSWVEKQPSVDGLVQALVETVEVQAVHIDKLNERLRHLERTSDANKASILH